MSDYSTVLLFADLSGSVQLYESLGDTTAKNIIVELQEQLGSVVTQFSGVVHEITGDELMCRFESAEHALECAAKIHQATSDYFKNPACLASDNLQMRIGVHSGTVIFENDRLFGDTINIANRIMSIAQAGQTITTAAVLQQLPPATQLTAREFDKTTLKGKSEAMVVYDIPWQIRDLTQIKQLSVVSTPKKLVLSYEGNSMKIGTSVCPVTLGRAINNFMVIDSDPVSRRHVSIEFLRDRFVLSDQSTNGTHVYPQYSEAIYLRREQLPLWGKGLICLGAPKEEALNHSVEYSYESTSDERTSDSTSQTISSKSS